MLNPLKLQALLDLPVCHQCNDLSAAWRRFPKSGPKVLVRVPLWEKHTKVA